MKNYTFKQVLACSTIAVSALAWPSYGTAQVVIGPAPTTAECAVMVSALNGGNNKSGTGWWRIGECGSSGISALGTALWAARSSSDTVYLKALVASASRVRHPNIFGTAREIATHASSTADARMMSLLALFSQFDPAYARRNESWATTMSVPMGSACRIDRWTDVFQVDAGALPADFLARMATTTETLMLGPTYPVSVRAFATCIRDTIADEYPYRIPTSAITLTYVCGDKFRVNNSGAFSAEVTYKVNNTSEEGDLVTQPGSYTEFVTETSGLVVLWYMGQPIRERANGGVPCS